MKNTITPKRARYAAFAILPAALLALSACEGDMTTPSGATTTAAVSPVMESTTVSPAPALSDSDISEMAMESVLSDEGITVRPGFAADYAEIVCQGFADGLDPMQMLAISADALPDFTQMEHATLIGASVGAFCPEFSLQLGSVA